MIPIPLKSSLDAFVRRSRPISLKPFAALGINSMPTKRPLFKHLSLKSRLFLAACLWVTAMIIAAGVGIPKLVKEYLVSDVESQLRLALDEISANLEAGKNGSIVLSSRLSDPRFSQPYSGLYWTATINNQTLRSRSLWDRTIQIKQGAIRKTVLGAKNERLIVLEQDVFLPEYVKPVHIVIGMDEAPMKSTLDHLTGQLWMILGLLFVGVMTVIGLQIAWSFRPLGKLQRELKALRAGSQQQLEANYPTEVSPLIDDLNALLFHYQELLQRARNHAGNLSHSLKTPLSVLRNEISQLDIESSHKLLPPVEQIQQHIDYHLGRARMAGSMNILSVKSNPSERVDAISMAFDKVYAERELLLINELDSELEVAVDQSDLDEMLGNLLENSYKWARSQIRVHSTLTSDDQLTLIIEDNGPGIAEEHLTQVLKRGVRLDETTPGTGLGLNIVAEMAYSYRGDLTLERSQLGGLRANLTLKLAAKG
ncbi:ATP-binding protein [Vibrio vulnificus]|nr:ATP-binding protein [Vibrio vulnificus]